MKLEAAVISEIFYLFGQGNFIYQAKVWEFWNVMPVATTKTRTPPNKSFNEQNNSRARAL